MESSYQKGVVLKNKQIAPNIYIMSLDILTEAKAGQFAMLKIGEGLDPILPRPLSIISSRNGCTAFLYEVRGKGTNLLSKAKVGDRIEMLGPLGNHFEVLRKGRVAMISGGIGIAPMLALAEEYGKLSDIDLISGFRSNSFFTDYISPLVKNVFISTEDGSEGTKGLVTDILVPENYDMVYTCGPIPMMKAVYEKCKGIVPVQVSMENRMACGFGACLGCSIKTVNGMKRVCKEGPVFNGEDVFYE